MPNCDCHSHLVLVEQLLYGSLVGCPQGHKTSLMIGDLNASVWFVCLQAVHLTAPLEKRFQKRLARDSAGAEQDAGSPMPAKKARNAQQQKGEQMFSCDDLASPPDAK